MEEIDEHDWYDLLQIPMSASVDDISKAFRQMARIKHPDRNKDDPDAASNFQLIKKASQILLDPNTRAAYDAKIQARLLRKKRDHEASANIQAMKNDLLAREKAAGEQSMRETASKLHSSYMSRLREEANQMKEEHSRKAAEKLQQTQTKSRQEIQEVTLVIQWKSSLHKYTQTDIKSIMKPFDGVQSIVMASQPGKAFVFFSSKKQAEDAMLLLAPPSHLSSKYGISKIRIKDPSSDSASSSTPIPPAPSPSPSVTRPKFESGLEDDEFEQMVLAQMKKAAAKKRQEST